MTSSLTVFGVASPYAWEVVETAWRTGLEPVCVDNFGGADPRLPGLTTAPGPGPFVLGLTAAQHRAAAAHRAWDAGLTQPAVLEELDRAVVDRRDTAERTARTERRLARLEARLARKNSVIARLRARVRSSAVD